GIKESRDTHWNGNHVVALSIYNSIPSVTVWITAPLDSCIHHIGAGTQQITSLLCRREKPRIRCGLGLGRERHKMGNFPSHGLGKAGTIASLRLGNMHALVNRGTARSAALPDELPYISEIIDHRRLAHDVGAQ